MAIISNGTTITDNGVFLASLGSMVHIKTITASNSSTLSFIHGGSSVVLNSTYPIYKFEFINMKCASTQGDFQVNYTTDGSNFNATQTSTFFGAYHAESNAYSGVNYYNALDVAQGSDAGLGDSQSSDNDAGLSGTLMLFNPSSTTFTKQWTCTTNLVETNAANNNFASGYVNTSSAVTGVGFKFHNSNISSGKIKLYGIKDS
jgi:hypothetical protein